MISRKLNANNIESRYMKSSFLLLVVFALVIPFSVFAGVINSGLIASIENQEQELILNSVPLNITEATDELVVTWSPAAVGYLWYAVGTPGNNLEAYTRLEQRSAAGSITIDAEALPIGWLTCYIASGANDRSAFFTVIRATDQATLTLEPITPAGGWGIDNTNPIFSWRANAGVPFYQILVADRPFSIINDEDGARVEGANIIWTAITSETSIQFGIDDPSGTIDNDLVPPLVGNNDPNNRTRYNWLVVNNYGNHSAYSSTVVGGISGFEVEIDPPFEEPENIEPAQDEEIYGEEFRFVWSDIEGAQNYFLYLSRLERTDGGSIGLTPVWSIQTTSNAVICPAPNIMENGHYNWKVIASNGQGIGAASDTTGFQYITDAGEITVRTRDLENNPVGYCIVEVDVVDGPSLMPMATNDVGSYHREIPPGTYVFIGKKEGYADTYSNPVTIINDQHSVVTIRMESLPSSIIGDVLNPESLPLGNANIMATNAEGLEYTTVSNISGQFSLSVDPGTWNLVAEKAGYTSSDPINITVDRGESIDLAEDYGNIVLSPFQFSLSGNVTNREGFAIALAEVTVTNGERTFHAFTPQSGAFEFDLGEGEWILSAVKPGYYLESGPIDILISGGDVEHNISLLPQAAIVGGMVFIDGFAQGEDDLQVFAYPLTGDPVITDVSANGVYSMGMAPGSYEVEAVLDGYSSSRATLNMGPGETVGNVNINLTANSGSVSGFIREPDGTPIYNAVVSFGGISTYSSQVGAFTLELLPGTVNISATKAHYASGNSGPVILGHGEDIQGINIVLNPNAATVSGRVASGGNGIREAVVTATPEGQGEPVTFTTPNNGNFTLGLEPNTYTLTVSKGGYIVIPPEQYSLVLEPDANVTGRNFSLQRYIGTIAGTITSRGNPLAGVTISVTPVQGGNAIETSTGVEGTFSLSVTPDRQYQVVATKTGYQTYTQQTENITVGMELTLPIAMSYVSCTVRGTVRSNNNPVASARVAATNGVNTYSANTNQTGQYVLSLNPGDFTFSVSAPGYTTITSDMTISPGQNITNNNYSLAENRAVIAGQVTNSNNVGLNAASVEAVRQEGGRYTATTDQDGYYVFNRLIGGTFSVTASLNGYTPQTNQIGLLLDGQINESENFALVAQTSGFSGTVRDQAGNPLANATVRGRRPNGTIYTTQSSQAGAYNLQSIPAGTYRLTAIKSGYTGIAVEDQVVDPGQTNQVDLNMVINDGSITGRVLVGDINGAGLGQATVSASSPLGHYATATSNGAGQFTLNSLYPNTTYTVSVVKSGYSADIDTLRDVANEDQINFFMLPNNLNLSGTTVNQAGSSLGEIPVTITSLVDGSTIQTVSDVNGNFTYTGLGRNSSYQLTTRYFEPGFTEADTTITLGLTNITGFNLAMRQNNSVITGNADVSATLNATRTNGGNRVQFSSAQGNYRFEELRAGTWTITPVRRGYIFDPASQVVNNLGIGAEVNQINFEADSAIVDIAGNAIDNAGNPLVGYRITLRREGVNRSDTTRAGGAFRFTNLLGYSNYSLNFVAPGPGYVSEQMEIDAEDQDIDDINLAVRVNLASITGVITSGEDNQPIANDVGVFIQVDNQEPIQFIGDNFLDGQYTLSSLTAGTYNLRITAKQHEPFTTTINIESGFDTIIRNIELTPIEDGIFFYLSRINEESVEVPLRGVNVNVNGSDGFTGGGYTGGDGLFYIADLDTSVTYSASFSKTGFVDNDSTGIRVGSNIPKILRPRNGTVLGNVNYEDGSPMEGATVRLLTSDGEIVQTQTDEYGAYSLNAPEGSISLLAENPEQTETSYSYNGVVAVGTYWYKVLQMENASQIVGTVRDLNDEPLATRAYISTQNQIFGTFSFAYASDVGAYRIRGLRPGNTTVIVNAAGYATVDPVNLEITAGTTETINWTLDASATGIAGNIVLADGETGIRNVLVEISGSVELTKMTDGNGGFSFLDLEPGDYNMSISKFGYEQPEDTVITVSFGAISNADRSLSPMPNQVTGTVYDEEGIIPLDTVQVNLVLQGGDTFQAFTDTLGHFVFNDIVEGEYALTCEGSFSPDQYDFVHEDGQGHHGYIFRSVPDPEEVGLARITCRLRYIVSEGDTLNVPTTPVVLRRLGSAFSLTKDTSPNGLVVFDSLEAPESYRLSAIHPDYGEVFSDRIDVVDDDRISLRMYFPSGQIRARIVDENEEPVIGHQVFVTTEMGTYNGTLITDSDGQVSTTANLTAGNYTVALGIKAGYLPTAPFSVNLETNNTKLDITVPLGIPFTPNDSISTIGVGDSTLIEIQIPTQLEISSAKLYYQNVGSGAFFSKDMYPAEEPVNAQLPQNNSGGVNNRANAFSMQSMSATQSKILKVMDVDDFVIYQGYIPIQMSSGTISYYPQIITTDNQVIGGPQNAVEIEVLNIGVLSRLSMTPTIREIQVGVPTLVTIQAYDEFGLNLTEAIADANGISWVVEGGIMESYDNKKNQILYLAEEEGDGLISVDVTQQTFNALLKSEVSFSNTYRMLESITVEGDFLLESGTVGEYKLTATDTSGVIMNIIPEWEFPDSIKGSITPVPYSNKVLVNAENGVIGYAPLMVSEPGSGVQGEFHPGTEKEGDQGIQLYYPLATGPNKSYQVNDGEGLVIDCKFSSKSIAGNTMKLSLKRPRMVTIQRYSNKMESFLERGYYFTYEGQVGSNENDLLYTLSIPLPPGIVERNPQIAVWDNDKVQWGVLGGKLSEDKKSISITFLGSELSLNNAFSIVAASKPLAIENLKFNPNPFSPLGNYPLSIEFTVHSDQDPLVWVTIEIFNMAGQHVRTLLKREAMGKGFQHTRENEPVIWDGLTDGGYKARNGRYLVQIIAEDSADEVDKFETVVLIK